MAISSSMILDMDTALASLPSKSNEKVSDLSTEVLKERHDRLVTERLAMPDDTPRVVKAGVTNRVKTIEKVLTERGEKFDALPQANQPVSLTEMTEDELLSEFNELIEQRKNGDLKSGRKAAATRRLQAIRNEVASRMETPKRKTAKAAA